MRFTRDQKHNFFLYTLVAIHHSLGNWNSLFHVKSSSHKLHILLLFFSWFYRFHGNIDCLKKYIKPNFNPFPITKSILISIQLRKDCLKADRKCLAWSSQNSIEPLFMGSGELIFTFSQNAKSRKVVEKFAGYITGEWCNAILKRLGSMGTHWN